VGAEVEDMKRFIESEKAKSSGLEGEMLRQQTRIGHLEDLLRSEKERVVQKERAVEELARQRDQMMGEHQDQLGERKAEYENLKRGFDELHYESKNLRRTINQKQDEVAGLNRMLN
jgi:chromosome segregation ATPase